MNFEKELRFVFHVNYFFEIFTDVQTWYRKTCYFNKSLTWYFKPGLGRFIRNTKSFTTT